MDLSAIAATNSMLPDSIPESLWAEFRKMRKKIRAPMTEHAEDLIIAKLERWRVESGANPIKILEESIERSWRGVFLNGHGAKRDAGEMGSYPRPDSSLPSPTLCSLCKASLSSGWIQSRHGRICGKCN